MEFYVSVFLLLAVSLVKEKASAAFFSARSTTIATFNVALVPFYPGVAGNAEITERTQLLIEELKNSDVDIFCLQEVFFADIQRMMYRELRDTYPHVFTATDLTASDTDPARACTPAEALLFGNCTRTHCAGLGESESRSCFVENCANVSVTVQCLICITLYPSVITECLMAPASRFEINYGLMLLSRKALTDTRASGFNSQSQFRGYLEASVMDVGDIVCTHASSLSSTESYFGPPVVTPALYKNYDQQQYAELMTLFEVITGKDTPILVGDMNNGPASPGNTWELPFHYGLINARGLVSPYVLEDGRCTFCADNPPNVLAGFQSSVLIDHIYVTTDSYKGRVISSERILDESRTESGVPLSDHYGVRVTLRDTRSDCRWWERRRYYCPAEPQLTLTSLPAPQPELSRLCAAI